jgi:hypothetical protein
MYPDVLGMVAEERLTIADVMQCAVGVFPTATAVGQPVEVLLLLQNLTNQPVQGHLAIRTPTKNSEGHLISMFTPKPRMPFTLPAGECGLLHLPVTPQLPTPAGSGYPVRVQVSAAPPEAFEPVRPPVGGAPPNMLSVSPFRIAVLRDIAFTAQERAPGQMTVAFDVLPGRFPPQADEPMPRYEALWTVQDMAQEQQRAQAMAGEALRFTHNLLRNSLLAALEDRTRSVFGDAGVPLHPGEITVISKLLAYTMQEGLELEEGMSLVESHWFRRLCTLMAADAEVVNNLSRLVQLVYSAVVQDAVLLAFRSVEHSIDVDFGEGQERMQYAAKIVAALEGRIPTSLEHAYVPLVMGGTLLIPQVLAATENPWRSLDALVEARQGRTNLAGGSLNEVFELLDQLIAKTEQLLREMRIPRDE